MIDRSIRIANFSLFPCTVKKIQFLVHKHVLQNYLRTLAVTVQPGLEKTAKATIYITVYLVSNNTAMMIYVDEINHRNAYNHTDIHK